MLFKAAALRYVPDSPVGRADSQPAVQRILPGAVALYVALTVIWVWLLTFTPLSRAYPFVALAFAMTPLLGGLVFNEPMAPRLLLGIGTVLVGLFLIAG